MTLVREGYELAFEEIVRRYRKPLGRYAAAIVGSRSEDVTQDAFSKALLALRRDDCEIDLRPWLYRIVRNTALNDLRDRPAAAEELAETIAAGRSPGEVAEQREELTDLMRRLRALPQPQRAAIVMRELEGLSHDEIATALGLSGGAARQAIYRARQALRDGAGMLLPLPLLRALISAAGPGAAETAVGAAGAGGAAVALKATAATMLVAGAVGAGIAIEGPPRASRADGPPGPDRAIAHRSPNGSPTFEGRQTTQPASRSGSAGEGAGSPNQRDSGSDGGSSSGPGDDGRDDVSAPSGHRSGPSGHDRGGPVDGDAQPGGPPPPNVSGDSRHGGSGTGDDDAFEHSGDDGSELHSQSDSGTHSGEGSSGESDPLEAEREEAGSSEGGHEGSSDGGETPDEVVDPSSSTTQIVEVTRDSRPSDGLNP